MLQFIYQNLFKSLRKFESLRSNRELIVVLEIHRFEKTLKVTDFFSLLVCLGSLLDMRIFSRHENLIGIINLCISHLVEFTWSSIIVMYLLSMFLK